ncbi:MAG: endonuclease/exonuclease/phosphatase family protein, partial [Cypionkella sp.]|nr:endonuclease/exonuclease/phosphatase family protein [Cypionkella sp.]
YKLAWMARMQARVETLLRDEEPLVICGDYNVIPQAEDAARPEAWVEDALFLPQTRAAYRRLVNLGLTDAFRVRNQAAGFYSFWDYQAGAWERNNGIRIDHLLLSPQAADLLEDCQIDKQVRAGDKPSDHVPVWIDLAA